jgi:CDP-diacylglycerol--serine O-phosphatidyltransferase
VLAYAAGLNGGWDAVALIYFVCCGVSRPAQFNVTAETLTARSGKVAYFEPNLNSAGGQRIQET